MGKSKLEVDELKIREIFEKKFGAQDYIDTYYPEKIDVDALFKIFKEIDSKYSQSSEIDIKEMVNETKVSPETIENLVIFQFQKAVMLKLMEFFPKLDASVLDVGGGPTIYQHIMMSVIAEKIIHSEFLIQNREEIIRWLSSSSNNWSNYFLLVKKIIMEDGDFHTIINEHKRNEEPSVSAKALTLEEIISSPNEESFVKLVKDRIKSVIYGDVFEKGLGMNNNEMYDIVTSNFTVESATGSYEKWKNGMKNISDKVEHGGYLVMSAIMDATWYKVGEEKVPAVSVGEKDIKEILKNNSFEVIKLLTLKGSDVDEVGYSGMVFVFAKKIAVHN